MADPTSSPIFSHALNITDPSTLGTFEILAQCRILTTLYGRDVSLSNNFIARLALDRVF
jgi:hypothetical protein